MSHDNNKEMNAGLKYEMALTGDTALATKMANSHIQDDPRHYSKLNAAGLDDCDDEPKDTISIDVVKPVVADEKLDSSDIGAGKKSPLKSSDIAGKAYGVVNNKNTVANTKTPAIGSNANFDQVEHFCAQIDSTLASDSDFDVA